jgi:hypothetical protein
MVSKTILCVLVLAGCAAAQPIGFGMKVGVPATDAFKVLPELNPVAVNAESHHYTVGLYGELRLPANLAFELDALYRAYDVQGAAAHTWEFPFLLKHRLLSGPVKPFFDAGLSFSHLSDINILSLQHRSNYGIVVGGGAELKLLSLRIGPELRYTGYAFRTFEGQVQSKRNQLTVLVGIGF